MKLANHRGRATLVVDDKGIDVEAATGGRFGPGLADIYAQWQEFREAIDGHLRSRSAADDFELDPARLGPPVDLPRQVFAIGVNYQSHADEGAAELPKKPATFTKFPTCLTGPFTSVELPPGARVDWEVELVVIIGQTARHATVDAAWEHVAGLCIGQDLSDRKLQFAAGSQFSLGKSHRGFGPMGPWLVTLDELADRDDLELGCSINGEVMQRARTKEMIFAVPALIVELSAVVDLLPGDVIFTGTPEGVGLARTPRRFLKAGEILESWIEGLGTMRTTLCDALPHA